MENFFIIGLAILALSQAVYIEVLRERLKAEKWLAGLAIDERDRWKQEVAEVQTGRAGAIYRTNNEEWPDFIGND